MTAVVMRDEVEGLAGGVKKIGKNTKTNHHCCAFTLITFNKLVVVINN
jgi:hypothetical protein